MSRIVLGSTGKPHAQCPVCGRVHPVLRRGDYLNKPVLRFRCRNPECRATWRATDEERQQVIAHLQADKPGQKQQGKPTKKNPDQPDKGSKDPGEKQGEKPERKKSFWDSLA